VELDTEAFVAFSLGLGLDDFEAADLAGARHMGSAVGLLVETNNVDHANLADRLGNEVDLCATLLIPPYA